MLLYICFTKFIKLKIFIISIYIRSSGCVACSTLQLGFLNTYNQLSYIELFSVIWITFITYFNGLYYMHDTVANYYSKYPDIIR